MSNDWVWDVETYPNCFTAAFEHANAPFRAAFEISDWTNDSARLVEFAHVLASGGSRLVGYNSLGFDYPILHFLLRAGRLNAIDLYNKAQSIIGSQDDEDRWVHQVYPSDRLIPQIDLFKIHHFDNKAKATGLKALQFAMRGASIEDLPFPVGTHLTRDQVPVLKQYNTSDVASTKAFLHHSGDMIRFREELCAKYPEKDWINFNDTKIGKEFFTMKLESAGIACYEFGPDGRRPRQTKRQSIDLSGAILPWIEFKTPEFTRILGWLRQQTITETKGVFKNLTATVDGFTFVFGLGGIHGSVENETVTSDADNVIVDLDVSSYYPNLAIHNRFYPAHLGEMFCDIYRVLYEQRKFYKKGTAENAMLKLALNGTYGDSNNPFSVFYDPLFTMRITLNGQLLLCLLAETLMSIPGLRLIQCNTDGLTVRVNRKQTGDLQHACEWWQSQTGMTLERVYYKRMFIADVNSYLAEDTDGNVKRKGRYEHDVEWHQDASALVIPKVAEQVLLHNAPIRQTIENWPDIMDFMLRIKVPRSGYLQWGDAQVQNTSRYLVTRDGKSLKKWLPPLKGKTDWRSFNVESGWLVTVCNKISDAESVAINHDFYVQEVEKLVLGLK